MKAFACPGEPIGGKVANVPTAVKMQNLALQTDC